MHVIELLQNCFRSALDPMHARRRESLLGSIVDLIRGRRLVLMDLARFWLGVERVAAPLKRIDRLLSNVHLSAERESIYAAMGRWSLRQPKPVIIVDWSPLGRQGQCYLLRAALAVGGRALTLWERVTPAIECNSARHEQALLDALQLMMPADVTPIMATDAGFKSPWFRAVAGMGWQYVGRVRGSVLVKPEAVIDKGDQWIQSMHLHALSHAASKDLGIFEVARSRPTVSRLILHAQPPRGRVLQTRSGNRSMASDSRKIANGHSEPLAL